jgi:PEP-CTERM motif
MAKERAMGYGLKSFLGATALVAIAGATAPASALVIGTVDNGGANCIPFGCNLGLGSRYQQVYKGSLFGSNPLTISSVRFYSQDPPTGGTLFDTDITISLSTTTAAVDGLSAVFDDNLGADDTLVFTGHVGGSIGSFFDIFFDVPFTFDGDLGNLLLDIEFSNRTGFGNSFLDAHNGDFGGDSSRMHDFGSGFAGFGLVTGFNEATTLVPEPATLALISAGMLGVGWVRRRRNAGAEL